MLFWDLNAPFPYFFEYLGFILYYMKKDLARGKVCQLAKFYDVVREFVPFI